MVTQPNATITVASGTPASFTLDDSGNDTVNATRGDSITIDSNTTTDDLNLSSGTAVLNTSAKVLLNGASDAVTDGANGNLTLSGTGGDTVNATSGDTITVGSANTTTDDLNVSSGTVVLSTSAKVLLNGVSDTVSAGSNDSLTLSGTGGDTVTSSSTGDSITIESGDTTADNLNVSSATVVLSTRASVVVDGSNNNVTDAAGASVQLTGSGTITAPSGDTITLGNDTQGTVTSTGDTIDLGSNDTVTASGDPIKLGSNTQATIDGSQDPISAGSTDTIHVSGQNDPVTATMTTVDVSGTNTGDTVSGTDDSGSNLASGGSTSSGTTGGGTTGGETGSGNTGGGDSGSGDTGSGDTGSGDTGGTGGDTGGGDVGGGDGGGDDFGGGGYGGGYSFVQGTRLTGSNVGTIAQYDLQLASNPAAAQAAQLAQQEAAAVANPSALGVGSSTSSVFEGARWDSTVITWSVATGPRPAGAPFSGYLGSQYQSLVQNAFQEWASVSNLTFKQVPDSAQADVRIGWGTFDTQTSGVLGYTSYQTDAGSFLPGVVIRLENPAQDALFSSGGQLTYSGTQATFSQVLEHEIGHALGLADNADPHSLLYVEASASNQTFDATDLAGIHALYAPTVTPGQVSLLTNATTLTINGAGFSTVPASNVVTFSNGSKGVVTAATPTQLTVSDLTGLVAGPLTVSVSTNGSTSGDPVEVAIVLPVVAL